MTEMDINIIKALADCDMSRSKAAEKLFYSQGTISYHCKLILKKTGKNPRKFYDLCELLQMIETVERIKASTEVRTT